MRGAISKRNVLFISLLIILLAESISYVGYVEQNLSKPVVVRYADSLTMPLPAIPLPSPNNLAPVSGVLRVLIVAAEFANTTSTKSIDELKQAFFGNVGQYYQEISYGAVSLEGDVVGWYRLNYPGVYYGRDCLKVDDSDCSGQPTSWWLARDAVALADKDVDFNNYDYFIIIHSGFGEESSRKKDDVWSVAYLAGIWLKTQDRGIGSFVIAPETEDKGAVPIGVYAHEFGHLLGLPDLYNTQSGTTVMGPWSLMDKGLWNGDPPGSSPSHMEAWSKIKLGWLNGTLLATANEGTVANYTLEPTEVNSDGVHAVKIPLSSSSGKKYYLVEVRAHIGFDEGLPSTGVLITYIDDSAFNNRVKVVDGHPNVPDLANATWTVGEVFTDEKNNMAVAITAEVSDSFQVTVNRVGPMPDLMVSKISTEPTEVSPDTTVTILIEIANRGTASAGKVPVQVFIDDQPFATKDVTLVAGARSELSFNWTAVVGAHSLRVVIDPYNALNELSKANNVAEYSLNVGPTLIITVPLDSSNGNVTALVLVNGVEYRTNEPVLKVTVPPGNVTVQVEPTVGIAAGVRQAFTGWSDGNQQNPRQITVNSDTSLKTVYRTQYLLTIDQNGGTTTSGGWFDANATVTANAATPSNVTENISRMLFENWSGDVVSNSTSLLVNMNKPLSLKANWKLQYYLNVLSAVGSTSGSGWYDAGTPATISVQPTFQLQNSTRHVFTGWKGAVSTQNTTATLVLNSPTLVEATWKVQYLVNIASPYGNPQGYGWFDAGSHVQISVQPSIEYANRTRREFSGWSGNYSGTDPSFSLLVDGPKNLEPHWITQYQLSFKVVGLPNSTVVKLNINNTYHDVSADSSYVGWFNQGEAIAPTTNQTLAGGFIQFAGWKNSTGDITEAPFLVTGPMDYAATYQTAFSMLAVPGFPVESIISGFIMGVLALSLLRRRRPKAK